MRTLQKPFTAQPTRQTDFCNYSNITKVEHERRERGFQVFISGANKERLKLRDLQEEALQEKKTKINNNNTSRRKIKPPNNTFARRRFWQKNSDIKIKGSDGSKFLLLNKKTPKLENGLFGSVLHDITGKKIDFHSNAKKNSQLNHIRNRYKAYFHIDGHGFCCSKQLSKPSTPARYQIDGVSPIFNRQSFKHLKRIQAKPISSSCSSQPYGSEEQQNQYYSLLNRNKKCISELREFLTPDYEYFQNGKEGDFQNSHKDIANEATLIDLYDGIDYDVFYHKEQNICRSARALLSEQLAEQLLNESDSKCSNGSENDFRSGDGNQDSKEKLNSYNESCLRETTPLNKLEENGNQNDEENIFDRDERTLNILLNNHGILNEFSIENKENKENKERDCLPPLEKAISHISKLIKSNNHHEEKERCLVEEHHCFLNKRDEISSNNISNFESQPRNVANEKDNNFKLNFRYICQDLNSKFYDMANLDMLQSYGCDQASTDSNDNGSSQTPDLSTIDSSTPSSTQLSFELTTHRKQQKSRLLLEKPSKQLVDVDIIVDNNNKNISSICQNRHLKIEGTFNQISPNLRGKLLSARVQKLDIKKQIYLSHILDKLEIVHVSKSVDFFCHFGLHGLKRNDSLFA